MSRPDLRELALLAMAAVGRGGQGDVGQRIRDEILTVQSRNGAKVRSPRLRALEARYLKRRPKWAFMRIHIRQRCGTGMPGSG